MRRLVVALVLVLALVSLAVVLSGCGGGAKTETAAPAAAPAASTPEAAPAPAVLTSLSDNEPEVFQVFPSGPGIPSEVSELVDSKQPTLIYFYDASQNSSKETRKIIDAVLKANRGLVELVAYDIGKYVNSDAADTVALDEDFAADATYQKSIELARVLGVSYTPYIVITDSQGYITWKFKGLAEKDFLEREVLRAAN